MKKMFLDVMSLGFVKAILNPRAFLFSFVVFIQIFLFVLFFPLHVWAMGERPDGSSWCSKTGLYLKMEETLLYIPSELTKRSSVRNNRAIPEKPFCYQKGSAPLEIDSLSLFPTRYYFREFSLEGQKPKRDEIGRFLGLWLSVAAYKENKEDDFERLRVQYEIDLDSLPQESGFYIFQGKHAYEEFFISDTALLKTSKGNPVVFTCFVRPTEYCQVRLIRDNVGFGMSQINRHHIPIQDWPKFYRQFEALADRLIIQNEEEIKQLLK